jgi:homoserine kinase type II
MAVYTDLDASQLSDLVAAYDIGALVSAKGIAEGISNSNWLIETRRGDGRTARFILTMYERRIDTGDLPFFLDLLDHLAARGCAVPATIHDRSGASLRRIGDKAVALIAFLPGISPSRPTSGQAHAVGAALARVHLAARDFPRRRRDRLDPPANRATLERCGSGALAAIHPELPQALALAAEVAEGWPTGLPRSIIHSDLFPDNVLMLGETVTGLIDFYFACEGMMAYDLAVTHAAWAFAQGGAEFLADVGRALVTGYETVRPLAPAERAALPVLAEGACLRFTASRAEDWLEPSIDRAIRRKDPMEFLRRWRFYRENRTLAFASR